METNYKAGTVIQGKGTSAWNKVVAVGMTRSKYILESYFRSRIESPWGVWM